MSTRSPRGSWPFRRQAASPTSPPRSDSAGGCLRFRQTCRCWLPWTAPTARPERAGLHVVRTDPSVRRRSSTGAARRSGGGPARLCAGPRTARSAGAHRQCPARGAVDPDRLPGREPRGARERRHCVEPSTLSDPRSESPWETVLRLFHVVCEAPVEPQREILDETGAFVARADLWVVGTRSIHEYDGGVHLERRQQQADLARARRLSDAGWTRRGYTSHDLLRTPVGILRDVDRALGRPHDPSRLRALARAAGRVAAHPGRDRTAAVATARGPALSHRTLWRRSQVRHRNVAASGRFEPSEPVVRRHTRGTTCRSPPHAADGQRRQSWRSTRRRLRQPSGVRTRSCS